jgi:hypothetical protein
MLSAPIDARQRRLGLLLDPELFPDQLREGLFDLRVAWDWCFLSGVWVQVYVVITAVPLEIATRTHKFANEVATLHTSTPMSLV